MRLPYSMAVAAVCLVAVGSAVPYGRYSGGRRHHVSVGTDSHAVSTHGSGIQANAVISGNIPDKTAVEFVVDQQRKQPESLDTLFRDDTLNQNAEIGPFFNEEEATNDYPIGEIPTSGRNDLDSFLVDTLSPPEVTNEFDTSGIADYLPPARDEPLESSLPGWPLIDLAVSPSHHRPDGEETSGVPGATRNEGHPVQHTGTQQGGHSSGPTGGHFTGQTGGQGGSHFSGQNGGHSIGQTGGQGGSHSSGQTGPHYTGQTGGQGGSHSSGQTGPHSTGQTGGHGGSHSSGQTGPHSTGQTGGQGGSHSTGQTGSHSTGQTGGQGGSHSSGPTRVQGGSYSSGQTGGHSTGQTGGQGGSHSSGQTGGHSTGQNGGQSGSSSSGHTGTHSTGQSGGQGGSFSSEQTGGHSTGHTGGHSTGQTGGQGGSYSSGHTGGKGGSYSSGNTRGQGGGYSTSEIGVGSEGKRIFFKGERRENAAVSGSVGHASTSLAGASASSTTLQGSSTSYSGTQTNAAVHVSGHQDGQPITAVHADSHQDGHPIATVHTSQGPKTPGSGYSSHWKNKWNKFTSWSANTADKIADKARQLGDDIAGSADKVWHHLRVVVKGLGSSVSRGAAYCVHVVQAKASDVQGSELINKLEQKVKDGNEEVVQFFQILGDKVLAWKQQQASEGVVDGGLTPDSYTPLTPAGTPTAPKEDLPDFFKDKDIQTELQNMVSNSILSADDVHLLARNHKGGKY